jgi:hypothetical protein
MSRLCPGKEVSAASDDFRLKEKKVWLKGRQRIVAIEAEQVAFVMQIGRRQLISLRQADLADLLEAALGSVITGINTCCAAALASTALHNGAYTTVFDPKRSRSDCSLLLRSNRDQATGQLVFHIFGALAEFERDIIRTTQLYNRRPNDISLDEVERIGV